MFIPIRNKTGAGILAFNLTSLEVEDNIHFWNTNVNLSSLDVTLSSDQFLLTTTSGQVACVDSNFATPLTLRLTASGAAYQYSELYNDRYYITITSKKMLLCISALDMKILWSKTFKETVYFPHIANGLLYLNYNFYHVLILDLDGNLVSVWHSRYALSYFDVNDSGSRFVSSLRSPALIAFDANRVTTNCKNNIYRLTSIDAFQPTDAQITDYASSVTAAYAGTETVTSATPYTIQTADSAVLPM